MSKEIKTLLDELADLRIFIDLIPLQADSEITKLLTPEQLEAVNNIKAQFLHKKEATQARIVQIEETVRKAVIEAGLTVKGDLLQAIYVEPKLKWDSKKLQGYAQAHQELWAFAEQSEPSVQIRTVKK